MHNMKQTIPQKHDTCPDMARNLWNLNISRRNSVEEPHIVDKPRLKKTSSDALSLIRWIRENMFYEIWESLMTMLIWSWFAWYLQRPISTLLFSMLFQVKLEHNICLSPQCFIFLFGILASRWKWTFNMFSLSYLRATNLKWSLTRWS